MSYANIENIRIEYVEGGAAVINWEGQVRFQDLSTYTPNSLTAKDLFMLAEIADGMRESAAPPQLLADGLSTELDGAGHTDHIYDAACPLCNEDDRIGF